MSMTEKTIVMLRRKVTIEPQRTLTVTAQLHSYGGQEPRFSVTAEERNLRRRGNNQIEVCGCMHEDVLKHWPDLKPVVDLHLSDEHGVPIHAVANALYWCGIGTYSDLNVSVLAHHLRLSQSEAEEVINLVGAAEDPKATMEDIVAIEGARWQREADLALSILKGQAG